MGDPDESCYLFSFSESCNTNKKKLTTAAKYPKGIPQNTILTSLGNNERKGNNERNGVLSYKFAID